MKSTLTVACLLVVISVLPCRADFADPSEAVSALDARDPRFRQAYDYLLGCKQSDRRPLGLLRMAKMNVPDNRIVVRQETFDLAVSLLASWRVKEAIPFLLDMIDVRYADFTYGQRRERETRTTDQYFPCLQAIQQIGVDAAPWVAELALLERNTEKGKLALSCLIRIRGKDAALQTLRSMSSDREKETLRDLLSFGDAWRGEWILEKP